MGFFIIPLDVKTQISYTKEKHFLFSHAKSYQVNLCQVNLMFAEKQFL